MPLWSKKRFRWQEPKAHLRVRDAAELAAFGWKPRLLLTLLGVAAFSALWWLAQFNPQKEPPPFHVMLLIATAGSLFFVNVVPWLNRHCPSEVRLFEAWLSRGRGSANMSFKYTAFESFRWESREASVVLVLQHKGGGRELTLGVPNDVPAEEVSEFLVRKGLRLQTPGATGAAVDG